ncbi:hypothetical protein EVAR_54926_1 [Eumeta japonica]|uniref:Uncharacterized protein n=1 Tax=Eumeta variegata TaxID=151549 RepID=A0A4C1YCW0_EUMVA|nr:hypothetical protein EVAR_54926_1 [Eumeta japonica]
MTSVTKQRDHDLHTEPLSSDCDLELSVLGGGVAFKLLIQFKTFQVRNSDKTTASARKPELASRSRLRRRGYGMCSFIFRFERSSCSQLWSGAGWGLLRAVRDWHLKSFYEAQSKRSTLIPVKNSPEVKYRIQYLSVRRECPSPPIHHRLGAADDRHQFGDDVRERQLNVLFEKRTSVAPIGPTEAGDLEWPQIRRPQHAPRYIKARDTARAALSRRSSPRVTRRVSTIAV